MINPRHYYKKIFPLVLDLFWRVDGITDTFHHIPGQGLQSSPSRIPGRFCSSSLDTSRRLPT